MKHIRLHGLRQPFDMQCRRPRGVAQTKRLLNARHLARKKCRGNLRQRLGAARRQTETRVRRHGDMAAHRLAWVTPMRGNVQSAAPNSLIAFKAQFNHLPS